MRFSTLLRHGVVAGAVSGVCAVVALWLVVEPVIRRALVLEELGAGNHHGEDPVVSRSVQLVGGAVTSVLVGVMFGVVFAVVFAKVRHHLPAATDFGRSAVLAAVGFGVFTLLPALKVPANPPGVGDPATVTERSLLYVLTILLGLLAVGAVAAVDRALVRRGVRQPVRRSVDVLVSVAAAVAILLAVPGVADVVPANVPAGLLWEFRLASLAQLATMWTALALTFGVLVDRPVARQRSGLSTSST